ncbi:MAG: hypothetical protein ACI4N3_04080, partial [Alphaproteobacteria bacterium]
TPVKSKSYNLKTSQNLFKTISILCLLTFLFSFNAKAYTASQVESLCFKLKSIFASDIDFSNNKDYKLCNEFSCDCYDSNPESMKQVIFAMDICNKKFESYKESLKQKEQEAKNETMLKKENEPVEDGSKWYNKKIEDYTDTDTTDFLNSRNLYNGKFSCTSTRNLRWTCENDEYICQLYGLSSQPNNPPKYTCEPISKQLNNSFDDSFEDFQDEMDTFALSHLTGKNKKITEKQIAISKFLNIRGEGGYTKYTDHGNGNFTVIHNGKTTKVYVDENNNVTLLEE